jgi:hypothetical protein
MAVSALPVLIYPALMRSTGAPAAASWKYHVNFWTAPGAYVELLQPFLLPLLLAVLLVLLTAETAAREPERGASASMPPHELAALAGFASIPAGAVLLAALTTGSFSLRYGMPGVIGIACLLVWMVNRSSRHAARHGAVLASVFLAFFTGIFGNQLASALHSHNFEAASPSQSPELLRVPKYPGVPAAPTRDLPIVIANGLHFMEIDHTGDDALVGRMYYLTDIDAALRRTGAAWLDYTYPEMKRRFHLRANIEPADRFLARGGGFLMYSSGAIVEWLPQELLSRGWHIRLLARDGSLEVTEVTPPSS